MKQCELQEIKVEQLFAMRWVGGWVKNREQGIGNREHGLAASRHISIVRRVIVIMCKSFSGICGGTIALRPQYNFGSMGIVFDVRNIIQDSSGFQDGRRVNERCGGGA
jgi:hypothetical protein